MSDEMSEIAGIADLFLSELRDKQGGGRARPVRVPPGGAPLAQETTNANMGDAAAPMPPKASGDSAAVMTERPVAVGPFLDAADEEALGLLGNAVGKPAACIVVAPHISGVDDLALRVASAVAGDSGRVGVLACEPGRAGVWMIDSGLPADGAGAEEVAEIRAIEDAVGELASECESWVVSPGGAWEVSGAALIRASACWVVPVGVGDEAVIAAYRTVKNLAQGPRAGLVLAAMSADALAGVTKLRGVIKKFLDWETTETVLAAEPEAAHRLLSWTAIAGQPGDAWLNVATSVLKDAPAPERWTSRMPDLTSYSIAVERKPEAPKATESSGTLDSQVMEYLGTGPVGVITSVMAAENLVECDVEPPGPLLAKLAVDGEGRLLLLAALGGSVGELADVGRALTWLTENAGLVARAMNFAADPLLAPRARLYVTSEKAGALARMFAGTSTSVHGYRTLRWGEKRGLLMEAA